MILVKTKFFNKYFLVLQWKLFESKLYHRASMWHRLCRITYVSVYVFFFISGYWKFQKSYMNIKANFNWASGGAQYKKSKFKFNCNHANHNLISYQSSSWWLPAFEFDVGDASVSSFISTLPCFFIFSCLRHFALLFWNHTCTLASVKSIRFKAFQIRFWLVGRMRMSSTSLVTASVTNKDLKNFLSEIFSGINIRIVSFLKHSFELAELCWSKSRPDEKSLGCLIQFTNIRAYIMFAQRNIYRTKCRWTAKYRLYSLYRTEHVTYRLNWVKYVVQFTYNLHSHLHETN